MGSVIIQEVLRDLLPQGLLNASKLMLTGSRYEQCDAKHLSDSAAWMDTMM